MGYRGKERNSLKISSPKIIVELGGIRDEVLHENQFFPLHQFIIKDRTHSWV